MLITESGLRYMAGTRKKLFLPFKSHCSPPEANKFNAESTDVLLPFRPRAENPPEADKTDL